jgi:hypothetical protein
MSPGLYFSRTNTALYRPDSDSIETIVWYDNLMLIRRMGPRSLCDERVKQVLSFGCVTLISSKQIAGDECQFF